MPIPTDMTQGDRDFREEPPTATKNGTADISCDPPENTTAADADVLALSAQIIAQNHDAYEVLSK